MYRRKYIYYSFLTLFTANTPYGALAQEIIQPNIVLIIADDMGYSDTSTKLTNNGHGDSYLETPTLHTLAEEGVAFTNAYVNGPNCAPARAAILSGQYAPRVTNTVYLVDGLDRGGNSTLLVPPEVPKPGASSNLTLDALPIQTVTIAETLQDANYYTAHVGKFHVTNNGGSHITEEHGFDVNYGGTHRGTPGVYRASTAQTFGTTVSETLDPFALNYTTKYIVEHIAPYSEFSESDLLAQLVNTNIEEDRRKYITDAVTDAAIESIEASFVADDGAPKPLFLHWSHYAVHSPVDNKKEARPDLRQKYQDKPNAPSRSNVKVFAGVLEHMDQAIDRLIHYLSETSDPRYPDKMLSETTLVVFISDNGGRLGQSNNAPFKGQKGELHEGGIRVPMIAWSKNPDLVLGGRIVDTPVSGIDLFETFRTVGEGQRPPADAYPEPTEEYPIDGDDLSPIFSGAPADSLIDRPIYWHLPGYLVGGGRNLVPQSVVRKGPHKLVYLYETGKYLLYDLEQDPQESTNLALESTATPELEVVGQELAKLLQDWLDEVDAPYPTVRSTGAKVPPPPSFAITPLVYDFSFGAADINLTGSIEGTQTNEDLTITLTATGIEDIEFQQNDNGVGVFALNDNTSNISELRRIDGDRGEAIRLAFNCETSVQLISIEVGAFQGNSGSEVLHIQHIDGPNPFANLSGEEPLVSGIDTTWEINENRLSIASIDSSGKKTLSLANEEGAYPIVLQAGTVLEVTASPTTSGGVLFNKVSVTGCI